MSSATPGSKANWGCASFTCAAWPKCKWKCSGPASPTTCNDGSDSANCKPQPPNKQRDREIQKLLAQKTNHVSATASPNLARSPARLFKDGFFTASVFARSGDLGLTPEAESRSTTEPAGFSTSQIVSRSAPLEMTNKFMDRPG